MVGDPKNHAADGFSKCLVARSGVGNVASNQAIRQNGLRADAVLQLARCLIQHWALNQHSARDIV